MWQLDIHERDAHNNLVPTSDHNVDGVRQYATYRMMRKEHLAHVKLMAIDEADLCLEDDSSSEDPSNYRRKLNDFVNELLPKKTQVPIEVTPQHAHDFISSLKPSVWDVNA